MVFPGVLRGRPGPRLATTPTSRPRRSLSSPGMCCPLIVAAGDAGGGAQNKSDADPSRLRNPPRVRPEGLSLVGWRGLTPRWPRSLRLSSASGFNLASAPVPLQDHSGERSRILRKKWAEPTSRAAAESARGRSGVQPTLRLLGSAYRCCDNGGMENPELFLPPAAQVLPAPAARGRRAGSGQPLRRIRARGTRPARWAARADRQRARSGRRAAGQVLRGDQGRRPAAAEAEAADDGGHGAGLGRRLQRCSGAGSSRSASSCCCSCTRWAT